ncbi:hypothetical protein D3C73_1198550 [compost metagenome]
MGRCDHLNIQVLDGVDQCSDISAVRVNDCTVIALVILRNVEPGFVAEQLLYCNMSAEDVAREEDFIFHTIGDHRFSSMKIRCLFEQQSFTADIQRIPVFYNEKIPAVEFVHFLQFRYSNCGADNGGVQSPGGQCSQSPGMVRLCMVDDDIFNIHGINELAEPLRILTSKFHIHGINHSRFAGF